jgi:hypothetical protein
VYRTELKVFSINEMKTNLRLSSSVVSFGTDESGLKRLIIQVKDPVKHSLGILKFGVTDHVDSRMAKRAIKKEAVSIALLHGTQFHKQGLVFHVMGDNNLPYNLHPQVEKLCRNLVVVTDENSGCIITSYRNSDPMRYVKKKAKRKEKDLLHFRADHRNITAYLQNH